MKKTKMSCEKQMHIPQELFSEILSWLDVDSLLRFKTVCKAWCYLIEDRTFIHSHMMKSRGRWIMDSPSHERNLVVSDSYFGLILECNYRTQYSRLRNPSTRKIHELPYPDKHIAREMKMCHIHSSGALKLAVPSMYPTFLSVETLSKCVEKVLLSVLTVGIDSEWRDIDIPFSRHAYDWLVRTVMVREIYFMLLRTARMPESGLEVICLEMGSEQISRIKVPDCFFPRESRGYVTPLAWGESLTLACVIEDEVHIWVLEDHKKVRWAEKKIVVPIKFVVPPREKCRYLWRFQDNGLVLNYNSNELFLLDVPSGKVKWHLHAPQGQEIAYYHVPSLQHPKGDETKRVYSSKMQD